MAVRPYYTTKKGKKRHTGWRADLVIGGVYLDYKLFRRKDQKVAAEYWLEERKKQVNGGTFGDKKYSLSDVFDHYLASKRLTESARSSKTYYKRCHVNFLRLDQRWLQMPIADLNLSRLSNLLKELKDAIPRKRKHLARELDFLSACIGHYRDTVDNTYASPMTKEHRYTFGKAARRSGKKKTNKVKKALDLPSFLSFLKDLKESASWHHQFEIIYYYMAKIAFIYGIRLGEVCGLEWSDIDYENHILKLTGNIQWFDEDGNVSRNDKVNRLKEEGELDDGEAIEYTIYPEVEKLLREIQAMNRSNRWVMANRYGDVPQYSKIYRRLIRTGYFNEAGHCFHKIEKRPRHLGRLWLGNKEVAIYFATQTKKYRIGI